MSTVRVTAAEAEDLTEILRTLRTEPTTILLGPGDYSIESTMLIGPITVVGEEGATRTVVYTRGGESLFGASGDGTDVTLRGLTMHGGAGLTGGALSLGDTVTATVEDCVLHGNSSGASGGVLDVGSHARLTMRRCVIADNSAPRGGALAVTSDGEADLTSCLFIRNRADLGGGMHVSAHARVAVRNCTFVRNVASRPDGGQDIFVAGSTGAGPKVELRDCLLSSQQVIGGVEIRPPVVNVAKYPGELILACCALPSGALDELVFHNDGSNVAGKLVLEQRGTDLWGLRPGASGSGIGTPSDPSRRVDLLGRPIVVMGYADPGALASPDQGAWLRREHAELVMLAAQAREPGTVFPIGANIAGNRFLIVEHVRGGPFRGQYRAASRVGGLRPYLVTVSSTQIWDGGRRHELALPVEGIARLCHIGPLRRRRPSPTITRWSRRSRGEDRPVTCDTPWRPTTRSGWPWSWLPCSTGLIGAAW